MTMRLVVNVGKYLLAVIVLAYLIRSNWNSEVKVKDGQEYVVPGIKEIIGKPVQAGPLVIALGAMATGLFLTYYRWYVLVRAHGLPFRVTDAIRLGLMGSFTSQFLPGSISGDVVKAAFIAREQDRRQLSVATVIFDRAIGLLGLCWIVALLGAAFWIFGNQTIATRKELQTIIVFALAISAASLAFWFFLGLLSSKRADALAAKCESIPKLGATLAEFWRAGWIYRCKGSYVFGAVFLALVSHFFFTVAFYCAAITFQDANLIPALGVHFVFFPIGEIIQTVPFTPGGAGLAEAAYGWLYGLAGSAIEAGTFTGIVYRLITWFWAVAGYLIYLTMRPASRVATNELVNPPLEEPDVEPAQTV